MCAWLRTTASTSLGAKGKSLFRFQASARRPWNSPQSSRIFCRPDSTRCIEPVTVRAAPQKVTLIEVSCDEFFAMVISVVFVTSHLHNADDGASRQFLLRTLCHTLTGKETMFIRY